MIFSVSFKRKSACVILFSQFFFHIKLKVHVHSHASYTSIRPTSMLIRPCVLFYVDVLFVLCVVCDFTGVKKFVKVIKVFY